MEADPENDFLQLSYTRHILETSCSLQVGVLLVKFRTPYSECFLSDRLGCEHRYACVSVCCKVVACSCWKKGVWISIIGQGLKTGVRICVMFRCWLEYLSKKGPSSHICTRSTSQTDINIVWQHRCHELTWDFWGPGHAVVVVRLSTEMTLRPRACCIHWNDS
jgi:hypothetical protein